MSIEQILVEFQPFENGTFGILFKSFEESRFFVTLEMSDKVCYSIDRTEWSFASYYKPSEVQSKDVMIYQVPAHASLWSYCSAGGSLGHISIKSKFFNAISTLAVFQILDFSRFLVVLVG